MPAPQHPHWQNDPMILSATRNAPALKLGAAGSGVLKLHEALVLIGAPPAPGNPQLFGAPTKALVETFQALYTLAPDGVAGAKTIAKLDALLMAPAQRKPWKTAPNAPHQFGDKESFFQRVNAEGSEIARRRPRPLPVSALLACAGVESGFGTGKIFKATGNLFSLQKWPKVPFPSTALGTQWMTTVISTNPHKTALAPFNRAEGIADAVRQWCEWIEHYGEADGPPGNQHGGVYNRGAVSSRERLMTMVRNPAEFAGNLWLVSFGEKQHAHVYAKVLTENNLTRFD
ncbi:MAG: hypothetical protein JNK48_16190 [Bryobacterales bacterium]|nr:hypothetical protein [Bryobacterales bacterium]